MVAAACEALKKNGLHPTLMVDCSHANSNKDPKRQPIVWQSILDQRADGRREIIGAMLESNLQFGAQPLRHRSLRPAIRRLHHGWLHELGHDGRVARRKLSREIPYSRTA